MTTLYLIRHGETDHNSSGRMQGWLDIPLNATGLRQAELLARRFKGKRMDAIYASPLARASPRRRLWPMHWVCPWCWMSGCANITWAIGRAAQQKKYKP